jgi:putative transposase
VRPTRTLHVLRTASPLRVAVDETAVKINRDWSWVYVAIDLDSRLTLDVAVFGQRGTDSAAAFLHRLTEKHDLDGTVFLVDGYGYLTSLFRLGRAISLTTLIET